MQSNPLQISSDLIIPLANLRPGVYNVMGVIVDYCLPTKTSGSGIFKNPPFIFKNIFY